MLVNSTVVTGKGAETAKGRTSEEIEQIRLVLRGRYDDLDREYEDAVAENQKLRLVEIGGPRRNTPCSASRTARTATARDARTRSRWSG